MVEPKRIESTQNPKVKDAVRLRDRAGRKKSGRFLVEGEREILLALDAGLRPDTLFVEPGLVKDDELVERAVRVGAGVLRVTPTVFEKIAVRGERDGLVAVLPIPAHDLDDLRLPSSPLVLAATGIEKPGNVGALLRSADAFGVDALVVEGGTDLWNPNVVRASLGCVFTVPVAAAPAGRLLVWLREKKLRIAAATPEGSALPSEADLTGPVAILVGSEEHGLDSRTVAGADVGVRIAMRGRADSLNVSVAAGVLLYEADRQRNTVP